MCNMIRKAEVGLLSEHLISIKRVFTVGGCYQRKKKRREDVIFGLDLAISSVDLMEKENRRIEMYFRSYDWISDLLFRLAF